MGPPPKKFREIGVVEMPIVSVIWWLTWWDVHGWIRRLQILQGFGVTKEKLPKFRKKTCSFPDFFPRKWWSKKPKPIPINQQWLQSTSQSHLHVFFHFWFFRDVWLQQKIFGKKKTWQHVFFLPISYTHWLSFEPIWEVLLEVSDATDMKAYCCRWNPCHTFCVCAVLLLLLCMKGLPFFFGGKMTP